MIKVGSLFSGIGGIELGLERAGGFEPAWFVENDVYCQEILKKNWPLAKVYDDITQVEWKNVERPDVLTGGFPCQDISNAGQRKGIVVGTRSSLWKEYHKAICALRPKVALIENVAALAIRGLNVVLTDLASAGYDAEWTTLSASDVGAPHLRKRLFIIAYPKRERFSAGSYSEREHEIRSEGQQDSEVIQHGRGLWNEFSKNSATISDTNEQRCYDGQAQKYPTKDRFDAQRDVTTSSQDVADANGGLPRGRGTIEPNRAHVEWRLPYPQEEQAREHVRGEIERRSTLRSQDTVPDTECEGLERQKSERRRLEQFRSTIGKRQWQTEPLVGRLAYGLPDRLARAEWKCQIKSLGNAVVPQCAEFLASRIKEVMLE